MRNTSRTSRGGKPGPTNAGRHESELIAKLDELLSREDLEVEDARAALLEAASSIKEQVGRQAILTALYETATEIIDVHVVGQVLQAAVNRAKVLLNSDLAYLALYEPQTKGTRVTATVGSISPDFGSLHVPFGAGMGGKVSQLRQPFFTPDYLNDERLVHLPRVDYGIKQEGVRGMIGVPLSARNQFLGALFVADRVVRHYSESEVSCLQGLAALIAVALENARLFEREEASLKQSQIAYQSLNARLVATEREASIHRRIVAILERNGSLGELSSVVEKELNATAEFTPPMGSGIAEGLDEQCYSADVGTPPLVRLTVRANSPLAGSDQRVLERVVQAAETLLLRKEINASQKALAGSSVFQRLLFGRISIAEAAAFKEQLEIDLLATCCIAAFRAEAKTPEEMMSLVRRAFREDPVLVAQMDGVALALFQNVDNERLEDIQRLMNSLAGVPVSIGMTRCPEPVMEAAEAARNAINSADLIVMLGRAGEPTAEMDIGPEMLLLKRASPADVAAYIDATIGQLIAYDAGHPGELIGTLRAYIDAGLNAARAAEGLGVHYKTVIQRLDRISRIAAVDLKDSRQLFRLQIALLMLGMRGANQVEHLPENRAVT
jgi:hypothetical protein